MNGMEGPPKTPLGSEEKVKKPEGGDTSFESRFGLQVDKLKLEGQDLPEEHELEVLNHEENPEAREAVDAFKGEVKHPALEEDPTKAFALRVAFANRFTQDEINEIDDNQLERIAGALEIKEAVVKNLKDFFDRWPEVSENLFGSGNTEELLDLLIVKDPTGFKILNTKVKRYFENEQEAIKDQQKAKESDERMKISEKKEKLYGKLANHHSKLKFWSRLKDSEIEEAWAKLGSYGDARSQETNVKSLRRRAQDAKGGIKRFRIERDAFLAGLRVNTSSLRDLSKEVLELTPGADEDADLPLTALAIETELEEQLPEPEEEPEIEEGPEEEVESLEVESPEGEDRLKKEALKVAGINDEIDKELRALRPKKDQATKAVAEVYNKAFKRLRKEVGKTEDQARKIIANLATYYSSDVDTERDGFHNNEDVLAAIKKVAVDLKRHTDFRQRDELKSKEGRHP